MDDTYLFLKEHFGLEKALVGPLLASNSLIIEEKEMKLTITIDEKTSKNALSKYTDILNKYYPKPWKVFILAKIQISKGIKGFLDLFFHNSKADVMNEMSTFSPSYLLKRENLTLLISIKENVITLYKIDVTPGIKRFVHQEYRYVIANEVKR